LKDRVPICLPAIIQKLVKTKKFATKESLLNGSFYQTNEDQSVAQKIGGFVWAQTIGRVVGAQ